MRDSQSHGWVLISPIRIRRSGSTSRQRRIRSMAQSEGLRPSESERKILPSTASRTVGKGDTPARRYERRTPSVHTSAGAALYFFFKRISDDAYAAVP